LKLLYGSSDGAGGKEDFGLGSTSPEDFGLGSSGLSGLFPPLPSDLEYFQKKTFQVGGLSNIIVANGQKFHNFDFMI